MLTSGKLSAADFPEAMGLSMETVSLPTHSGTHVDAPAHYGPMCEGKQSRTIDQMPLDWFYGRGVLIDLENNKLTNPITKDELTEALSLSQQRLKPRAIVLIKTGADKLWGTEHYFTSFRGMTLEATNWLLDQGIKVIGIDSFGFDAPFHQMIDKYLETKDQKALWPAHFLGRSREYCQIERLANLCALPLNREITVSCFPIKIKDAGAGWARVVAIVKEEGE